MSSEVVNEVLAKGSVASDQPQRSLYLDELLSLPKPLIINGRPHVNHSKEYDHLQLKILYPADQITEAGRCMTLQPEELPALMKAAQSGFEQYRTTTKTHRKAILQRLGALIYDHADELSRLITLETGKPCKLADHEVQRAAALAQGYADALHQLVTPTYELDGRQAKVAYFPIGPVLALTPFNFPLNLVMHKLAPAIAAGCSLVIKPSPRTPLMALRLGQLAAEAGYKAVSVVPCDNSLVEGLVKQPLFKKVSFTGSDQVGWYIQRIAGPKAVTLELGGNAACIVEDVPPAQLPAVAEAVAQGAFWFSGQVCIAVQRVYVHHALYDAFVPLLIEATRKLKVGDPLNPATDVGPMIDAEALVRSRELLREAINMGANVLYGGNTFNSLTMNPTLLNRTHPSMKVNKTEVFAPIATVTPYETFDDALTLVNDSEYGLQCGVYTQDSVKAERAFQVLDVGGVVINDVPTLRNDWLPYGGQKGSGMGREGVMSGIAEYSVTKTMIQRIL